LWCCGIDLGLDPYTAAMKHYSMSGLVGKLVQIAKPKIFSDQQIAQEQSSTVTTNKESLNSSFIDSSSGVVTQRDNLYQCVQQGFG